MEEDIILTARMKQKNERRRSSIFSLLNLQKKLKRQSSEPGYFASNKLNRKYSVDSAILSDYGKANGGLKEFLIEACSNGTSVCNGELAGAASDSDSEASRGMHDAQREDVSSKKHDVLARIETCYVEDPDKDTGAAGELVEEVAEENKSLLWFLLKQVRPGMDLSKVVLPTFILEPRSFLDKLSDNYYHADILSQAQHLEDPYQRFKCVLRWYLSGLYRKPRGLKKPYNPVLGETFRCCWRHRDSEAHTYYVAEQVSHHPPVSAFYVSNRKEGYVIEGSLLARSKFYGNSTSAILEGCARVHLLAWGETYVTTAPYAHCKGIVIGTLSMELGGKVQVICTDTGYHADIEFKLRLGRPEDWPKPRYKRSRKLYRCPECDFTGSLAKTKHHLFKKHKRKIDPKASEAKFYECSKCLREFADLSSYCEHLVHHGFEPMSCPECMASFPSYSKLVDHVKARTLVSLQRTQFFTKKREGAQLIIKYHCRKCKQEVRPNNKFAHWESHLEIRDFSELLIPKVEIDEGNARVCDDELDVNEQEEEALPLGPDMLKQVIAAVLLKNNNKECMVCKRIFDRKNDAKRHLIEHLLQDAYCNMYKSKSLKCQICHDGFGHSLDYKLHMRAHGGMPVYQCPDCGKSFSDSSNYTKHKKTHAIDTHACAVCGRKFLASISLDRHMELHEAAPISCPNCSLTFLTEAEFNRHSRTKHNSRKLKYRCVICKKRFESLRARWDHSWLAHRERKLQADCHICGQAYRKMSELRVHMKTMHNLDPRNLVKVRVESPSRSTKVTVDNL